MVLSSLSKIFCCLAVFTVCMWDFAVENFLLSWHALDMTSHSKKARDLMKHLGTCIYYEFSQNRALLQRGQVVSLELHGAEKFPALLGNSPPDSLLVPILPQSRLD